MNLRELAARLDPHCRAIEEHQNAIRLIEERMSGYTDPRDLAACADLLGTHYGLIADSLDRSPITRWITGATAEEAHQRAAEYLTEECWHSAHAEFRGPDASRAHRPEPVHDMEPDEWISGDAARWTPDRSDEQEDTP
ncbi:hypothetical protein Aca07nite_27870 [Actinoplanes capillaceus]|uniref:Uncharacterized protein n=1 Tax=Actinoplanes campanulatus TaxID=113559 RepID=A0ABQ3WH05_9ACTN|nr:hypothetical protein [Actinoplanes capillaceus]GID45512.1 hypothetical protein Aca07nite_27870 [Actinoplanes capillaceus]